MAFQLSVPTLSSGSFSTGPNDKVATVDIYTKGFGAQGAAVVNSIQDMNAGLMGTGLMDLIKGGVGGLTDFLSIKDKVMSFDPKGLAERVLMTSEGFKSSVMSLGNDILNKANVNTFADRAKGLMATVNGVKSMVDKAQVSTMNQLGGFINQYTNSNIFKANDSGALGGLLGAVVGKASDLGISGAFTEIQKTIKEPGVLNKVVKTLVPIALRNSDIRLLDEMSRTPAAKLINVFSPGFTNTLASVYRGNSASRQTPIKNWGSMLSTLGNVNSQWDKASRNGGDAVSNITALLGGSKDFQKLLVTGVSALKKDDPDYKRKVTYALAKDRKVINPKDYLKKLFPSVALTSVTGSKAMSVADSALVLDPRVAKNRLS